MGLGAEYRSGVTSDQWVLFAWRLLVAPHLAAMLPEVVREWLATASAVRTLLPGLEASFHDAPSWRLAEALVVLGMDARDGPPVLLLDLVPPRKDAEHPKGTRPKDARHP